MSVEDLEIRKAEKTDIPALAQVWHNSWHEGEGRIFSTAASGRNLAWFKANIGSNRERIIVAEIPAEIIGFVGWDRDGIDQLFVLPRYFGCGVAQHLFDACEDVLRSAGHQRIWLHCAVGNDRARAFYEKQGWRMVREFDVEMTTNAAPVPARTWHMEKNL